MITLVSETSAQTLGEPDSYEDEATLLRFLLEEKVKMIHGDIDEFAASLLAVIRSIQLRICQGQSLEATVVLTTRSTPLLLELWLIEDRLFRYEVIQTATGGELPFDLDVWADSQAKKLTVKRTVWEKLRLRQIRHI